MTFPEQHRECFHVLSLSQALMVKKKNSDLVKKKKENKKKKVFELLVMNRYSGSVVCQQRTFLNPVLI